MIFPATSLSVSQARRLAICLAFQYSTHPFLTPSPHQRLLLDTFMQGGMTIDQMLAHIEAHEYESERNPTIGLA